MKFKDADLIGIPFRIAVGKKGLAEGVVEVKRRNGAEVRKMKIDEAVKLVAAEVAGGARAMSDARPRHPGARAGHRRARRPRPARR